MFGKVKRWLNIEGVRISIECSDYILPSSGMLEGQLRIISMEDHIIDRIVLKLTETYSRGRGAQKRIDDYLLAESTFTSPVKIKAQEETSIEFTLEFDRLTSPVERFAQKNTIAKGLAAAASMIKGAKSEFRLDAVALIRDSAIQALDHKILVIA